MAKLKQLPSRLKRMPSLLGPRVMKTQRGQAFVDQDKARRDAVRPSRKWYSSARWQKLRWFVLVRDDFTCRMCGKLEVNTSLLVGDHIIPHRDVEASFWDETNLQCLCRNCHASAKQKEEQGGW